MPFDVVEVRVARQQDPDVSHRVAQLLDAAGDPVVHLRHPGIDQDVSLRRGN